MLIRKKRFNIKILTLFLVALSVASIASYYIYNSFLTTRPFLETGAYTEPAYSLYKYGKFIDYSSKGILDMDKFTYWVPPLHSLLQVPFLCPSWIWDVANSHNTGCHTPSKCFCCEEVLEFHENLSLGPNSSSSHK